MQKKLIALAVAGLVSGGAFAQSNVTVYGRANLGFDNFQSAGSFSGAATDFKSRNRVYDGSSRIGFKGTEDLGSGMKANFQIESGVNMDTGNALTQGGAANASAGTLGSRQSYVGLQGNFGEVRLGRQEVHWTGGRINDIGANETNTDGPIATGSNGIVGGPAARTSNVLMYLTPVFSGVQLAAGYVAGGETAPAGVDANGKGWSVQANYNNGPIAVKYDYTAVTTNNTAATDPVTGVPKNSGHKILVGYFYQGDSKVGISISSNTNANIAATNQAVVAGLAVAGNTLKQSAWVLNWEHYFGNIESIVEYGRINSASGSSAAAFNGGETGARYALLGARYFFSKRTTAYATWQQLTNGSQNWSDISNGGYSLAPGGGLVSANRGADPRVIAVGVMHNF
jgi:predicted porin